MNITKNIQKRLHWLAFFTPFIMKKRILKNVLEKPWDSIIKFEIEKIFDSDAKIFEIKFFLICICVYYRFSDYFGDYNEKKYIEEKEMTLKNSFGLFDSEKEMKSFEKKFNNIIQVFEFSYVLNFLEEDKFNLEKYILTPMCMLYNKNVPSLEEWLYFSALSGLTNSLIKIQNGCKDIIQYEEMFSNAMELYLLLNTMMPKVKTQERLEERNKKISRTKIERNMENRKKVNQIIEDIKSRIDCGNISARKAIGDYFVEHFRHKELWTPDDKSSVGIKSERTLQNIFSRKTINTNENGSYSNRRRKQLASGNYAVHIQGTDALKIKEYVEKYWDDQIISDVLDGINCWEKQTTIHL